MKIKSDLRRKVIACRDALSPSEIARRSAAAFDNLLSLSEFTSAQAIMFFVSFGSEIETIPMIKYALSDSKRVVVPRVDSERHAIVPCEIVNPGRDLAPGFYGIKEPTTSCPLMAPELIDIVIVPAAVWGEDGYRVGYGGGYYDRFLAQLPRAVRIGLGLELQVAPEVPHGPHDLPVDLLVTEQGVRRFTRLKKI